MKRDEIIDLLDTNKVLLIDGGLATELERCGYSLNHPLWSGKILQDDPNAIYKIHKDFYEAGADIAITSSYQTSVRGLREHLNLDDHHAIQIITDSVVVAQRARSAVNSSGRTLLIAGSVGPYGAYLADGSEYRGDYDISNEELKDFHRPRMRALVDAGVDLLALETIPNITEIKSLLELMAEFAEINAWLSCTLRDSKHISDGTQVSEVVEAVEISSQIVAFGVNCVSPKLVEDFLDHTRTLTSKALLCYPNSGEQFDATSKTWNRQADEKGIAKENVMDWHSAGAKLIGGCCRTTVEDIKVLSNRLK